MGRQTKILSFGGRATLVKVVLNIISNDYILLCPILIGALHRLDKVFRRI